ncbi:MAG: DUF2391 family protein [Natrialbaceae archaeon]
MATENDQTRSESGTDGDEPSVAEVEDIISHLAELEAGITDEDHREELAEAREMLRQLPGSARLEERITKYTSRDIGEAAVGAIIFAVPLLVEDGVFVIADHLLDGSVAGLPVFLLAHVAFVVGLTAGILYAVDFREVHISNPIFGLVPRRLVGVLSVSFLVALALMFLWGRLFIDDPSRLGVLARVTVIWAVAALGASLGDILPGESKGTDLTVENLDEIAGIDGRN